MYTIDKAELEHKIENGYEFKMGEYISKGISFFTDNFLKVILSTFVGSLIPLISFITAPNIYLAFDEIDHKTDNEMNALFKFDKAGKVILYYLLIILGSFVFIIPFFFLGGLGAYFQNGNMGDPSSYQNFMNVGFILTILAIIILNLILQSCIYFVIPLMLFSDYDTWDSVKMSFKLAKHHILQIFFLNFLVSIIASLGIILCYVGIFLTLPIMYTVHFVSFKDILFTDGNFKTEMEEIGSSYSN